MKRNAGRIQYQDESAFKNYLEKEVRIYPFLEKLWARFVLDIISRSGKKRMAVLDCGCGLALIAEHLHKEARKRGIELEITAIDLSAPMILSARERLLKNRVDGISLIEGDITNLPFPDNAFDLVIGTMVFFFLTEGQRVRFIEEAYRVLSPGSQLYLLHHNRNLMVMIGALLATWQKKEIEKARLNYTPKELNCFLAKTELSKGKFMVRPRWLGFLVEAVCSVDKRGNNL